MDKVLLELSREEAHALAVHLMTAEGYAQRQGAQYRDWALSLPTESQREAAGRLADTARAEYVEAMGLRDKLYRAAARAEKNEED